MGCFFSKDSINTNEQIDLTTNNPIKTNVPFSQNSINGNSNNPPTAHVSIQQIAHRASMKPNQPIINLSKTAVNNLISSVSAREKESTIELLFLAKRKNSENTRKSIYNKVLRDDQVSKFIPKANPKSPQHEELIKKALSNSFIFSSLSLDDVLKLVSAMAIKKYLPSSVIIKEGDTGDYFYIIESGTVVVDVGGIEVNRLTKGKSFGDLAIVYNTLRNASVVAISEVTVFLLDQITFKAIIAASQIARDEEIFKVLKNCSLFKMFTEQQLRKLCDVAELVPYNKGDEIIQKDNPGNIFYVIQDGNALVKDTGENFSSVVLGSGDYFGEHTLLTGQPRNATIIAHSNVCVLIAIHRDSFQSMLGSLEQIFHQNMTMRVLTSIKLFENLSNEEKEKLSRSFVSETFLSKDVIITEGEKGKKFFILMSGEAEIWYKSEHFGDLKAVSYFGELALMDDEVRKATVIAATECQCFSIERAMFCKIVGSLQHIMARETMDRLETLQNVKNLGNGSVLFRELNHLGTIGGGTTSKVYLVQNKKDGAAYALKSMYKFQLLELKQHLNVVNEKNILQSCNHSCIVKYIQTFKDKNKLYILEEFVQGGELTSRIYKSSGGKLSQREAKFYAYGVVSAISYLHSKEIAYRDLKPQNIMIDFNGYPKIIDFGFAKVINAKSFTLCGKPEYMAPEIVLGRGHTKAVDYWAIGVLIYEMICGHTPFEDLLEKDQTEQDVIFRNIVNARLVYPQDFNDNGVSKDLVKKLLSREVSTRLGNLSLGVDDILTHR